MKKVLVAVTLLAASTASNATVLTTTSLTSAGTTPSGVSEVGGVVFDVIGLNGSRVTSQLAASSLYVGYFSTTLGTIGTQSGWDSSVWGSLGGGIAEAAVRLTVSDGDTGVGEFDYDQNDLYVNSVDFGSFSDVATEETSNDGQTTLSNSNGFLNNQLSTGWFYNNTLTDLVSLYDSIVATGSIEFSLADADPSDNFFDFKQGVDGSLINVGSGPVVGPNPIPEPSTFALFAMAIFGFGLRKLKK